MDDDQDDHDTVDDDAIRSLLADVGPLTDDERLPDDVAARLDMRLDALVAERDGRTHRVRRGRLFLVAAAVVVVAGVGVPVVRGLGGGAGTTASSGSGGSGLSAQSRAEDSSGGGATSGSATPKSDAIGPGEPPSPAVAALTTADFDQQVGRLLASRSARTFTDQAPQGCAGTSGRQTLRREIERRIPITFDGTPALLEVHVPRDRLTRVDAVTCDGALLKSVMLG